MSKLRLRPKVATGLLVAALIQFAAVGLPPGNADLLSVHLLAYDLSHHDARFLYPGRDYVNNDAWVQHHEQTLRALHVDGEPNWCFYPPLVPLLCTPFVGAGVEVWRIVWGLVQIALAIAFALLIERMLRSAALPASRVLVFALVFGSLSVARSVNLGQTSLLIAVLIWLAVHVRQSSTRAWAGALSGAAYFVKPFLLVGEFPLRGRRRVLEWVVVAATVISLIGISVAVTGADANREYGNLLRTLGASQTAYIGNQSLLAGVMRWTTSIPVGEYGFQMDPTWDAIGKLLAATLLGVAFWAQRRATDVRLVYSIGLWYSAILLALPISWEHHLVVLLPVLAFLFSETAVPVIPLVIAAAAILISAEADYGNSFAGRIATNLPLCGNLILFILLFRLHLISRRAEQPALS
jgi:hypothetical protein